MIPRMTVTTLVFDVMGTVVDIDGSIAAQARQVLDLDDDALAALLASWDAGLQREMDAVVAGSAPWRPHRELRAAALEATGAASPEAAQLLTTVVHRLDPWPEAAAGLGRLRELRRVVALSNADMDELVDLSAHGGLAWHALLSAAFARSYKPDPAVYDMALELVGIQPAQAMLVAAHPWDLRAAAARGYAPPTSPAPEPCGPRATTRSTSTPTTSKTSHGDELGDAPMHRGRHGKVPMTPFLLATLLAGLAAPSPTCTADNIQQHLITAGKLTEERIENGQAVNLIRCGDVTADGIKDAVFTVGSGGTAGTSASASCAATTSCSTARATRSASPAATAAASRRCSRTTASTTRTAARAPSASAASPGGAAASRPGRRRS